VYLARTDGPNALTTKSMIHDQTYLTSTTLYDGLLRPRQTQSPSLDRDEPGRVVTDARHDTRGLVITQNDAWFATGGPGVDIVDPPSAVPGRTRVEYDGAARPIAEIFDVGEVEAWRTTTSYGGDRVNVDPPDGAVATTTISDGRGRTTELRQYTGGAPTGAFQATSYGYDHAGRLASVTDPAGNQWTYGYDLRADRPATPILIAAPRRASMTTAPS
jgi:hypothetical protein